MRAQVIDPDWVAAQRRRGRPALLRAGSYRLGADLDMPRHGLALCGPGVRLDGDGHTLTYGSARQPAPPSRWDAPAEAEEVAGPPGFPAAKAYRIASPPAAGDFVFRSGPIEVVHAGIEHFSAPYFKGSAKASARLAIVRHGSGEVVAASKPGDYNVGDGRTRPLFFTPRDRGPYALVATLSLPPGGEAFFGYASIERGKDIGLLCDRRWIEQADTYGPSLPSDLRADSAYLAARGGQAGTVIANLRVRHGSWGGFECPAIQAGGHRGLTVEDVRIHVGDPANPRAIYALEAQGATLLRRVRAETTARRITNRHHLPALVQVEVKPGGGHPVAVEGCVVAGAPGVAVWPLSDGPVSVRGNRFVLDGAYPNAYAIYLDGLAGGAVVERNAIAGPGRGIVVDTYSRGGSRGVRVVDNLVDVREPTTLDDGDAGASIGIQLRCDERHALEDVLVEGNRSRVECGPGRNAYAMKILLGSRCRKVRVVGNTFSAEREGGRGRACALYVAAVPDGSVAEIRNNVYMSNQIGIALAGNDGGASANVTIAGGRLVRIGEDPGYHDAQVGWWDFPVRDARFEDLKWSSGKPDVLKNPKPEAVATYTVAPTAAE